MTTLFFICEGICHIPRKLKPLFSETIVGGFIVTICNYSLKRPIYFINIFITDQGQPGSLTFPQ